MSQIFLMIQSDQENNTNNNCVSSVKNKISKNSKLFCLFLFLSVTLEVKITLNLSSTQTNNLKNKKFHDMKLLRQYYHKVILVYHKVK